MVGGRKGLEIEGAWGGRGCSRKASFTVQTGKKDLLRLGGGGEKKPKGEQTKSKELVITRPSHPAEVSECKSKEITRRVKGERKQ